MRKVLLYSPVLEWFRLCRPAEAYGICAWGLRSLTFGISPAVPFTWLKSLLSGVTHFLHCP